MNAAATNKLSEAIEEKQREIAFDAVEYAHKLSRLEQLRERWGADTNASEYLQGARMELLEVMYIETRREYRRELKIENPRVELLQSRYDSLNESIEWLKKEKLDETERCQFSRDISSVCSWKLL